MAAKTPIRTVNCRSYF